MGQSIMLNPKKRKDDLEIEYYKLSGDVEAKKKKYNLPIWKPTILDILIGKGQYAILRQLNVIN